MLKTRGFAAQHATTPLNTFEFQRREPGSHDVLIEILYCGVCHSDIHQVKSEWPGSIFPMVPGHEIVGKITQVGAGVTKFKVGDFAGVGCFVDSCRTCGSCRSGLEQYCEDHMVGTYNSVEKDKKTPTYGGYSNQIVMDENYTLHIPANLALERVAPLLCAGITTYSPLRHWNVGPGKKIAILGLGGLGHMGVKFAAAFGADVTVLSHSKSKEKDAQSLGAHAFALTSDEKVFASLANRFDFILNSVSAPHDINAYMGLLKTDGAMVLLGVPEKPALLSPFSLIARRKTLAGSMIGGIKETQEMLDFCGKKNVMSDVEVIPIKQINTAYERMIRGDVHYRFVIDMKTL